MADKLYYIKTLYGEYMYYDKNNGQVKCQTENAIKEPKSKIWMILDDDCKPRTNRYRLRNEANGSYLEVKGYTTTTTHKSERCEQLWNITLSGNTTIVNVGNGKFLAVKGTLVEAGNDEVKWAFVEVPT